MLFRRSECCLIVLLALAGDSWAAPVVDRAIPVASVWAGHPVGFCLLTHAPWQFAAFYDAERRMTVGARRLDSEEWRFEQLPERVGWDSHNYITMTVDDGEHLHLSGNLHVHPLKYFRTAKPLDIGSFERVPEMIGENEEAATYPRFFRGPDNQLLFTYRDGRSGDGNQIYNVYDHGTRTWRRLLDTPLLDGQGERNAYLNGPLRGPDGYWHLCWVWRETSDCATNHDPSYARSKDLIHWEDSGGKPIGLPITLGTGEIVDPVPVGGGVINGNVKLGFDGEKRPVLAYHKYDAEGITQLYNARLEAGVWRVYQSSDWDYRWAFSGGGAIPFEVRVKPLRFEKGVGLVQGWSHDRYGRQQWRLDTETLRPVEQLPLPAARLPNELNKVRSDFPGMTVRFEYDSGQAEEAGITYALRWETLGAHRDRPREKPWPEAVPLELYRIRR